MFLVGARDRKNEHVGFVFKLGYKKVTGQICIRHQIWRWVRSVKDTRGWLRGRLEFEGDVDRGMWMEVGW